MGNIENYKIGHLACSPLFKAPEPYRGVIETIRYFEPEPKKPEPVITQDACINRVYYGTPEEIAEMKKRDKVI